MSKAMALLEAEVRSYMDDVPSGVNNNFACPSCPFHYCQRGDRHTRAPATNKNRVPRLYSAIREKKGPRSSAPVVALWNLWSFYIAHSSAADCSRNLDCRCANG